MLCSALTPYGYDDGYGCGHLVRDVDMYTEYENGRVYLQRYVHDTDTYEDMHTDIGYGSGYGRRIRILILLQNAVI